MPKGCSCCRIPNTTSKCCTQPSGGRTLTSCRLGGGGWGRSPRIKPCLLTCGRSETVVKALAEIAARKGK